MNQNIMMNQNMQMQQMQQMQVQIQQLQQQMQNQLMQQRQIQMQLQNNRNNNNMAVQLNNQLNIINNQINTIQTKMNYCNQNMMNMRSQAMQNMSAKMQRGAIQQPMQTPPQANQKSNTPVTIEKCFEHYKQITMLEGNNGIYCNTCGGTRNAQNLQMLTVLPKVLAIVLNRGQGIQNYIKLIFADILDLTNEVQNQRSHKKYRLTSVIIHIGSSGASGHFIAISRDDPKGDFYCFNDDTVTKIESNEKGTKLFNYGLPYILFYTAED